jgi:hypothetical protein
VWCVGCSTAVHSSAGNHFVCSSPEASANIETLYVLRHVCGTLKLQSGKLTQHTTHEAYYCDALSSLYLKYFLYSVTNKLITDYGRKSNLQANRTSVKEARHLSLSWARSMQPSPSHFSKTLFNSILSSMPGSSNCSLSLKLPHKNAVCTLKRT